MPTLGEVAQFNAGTFAPLGRLGESFNTGVNIARGLQDIDIKKNEFAKQQEAEVNQILNATYQHPDWVSNDPHKMLGVLQDAKKIAQARNLPIAQGGALDQIEEGLFNAQSPQDLQRVNELFKSNLIRGGVSGVIPKTATINNENVAITETPIGGGSPVVQQLGQKGQKNVEQSPSQYKFSMPYPDARPNQYALNANEEPERQYGLNVRTKAVNAQVRSQENILALNKAFNTINELDKDRILQTGKVADIQKFFSELKGDPRYKELSKQLADLELRDAEQAGGGAVNTVAGLDLRKVASGDETFPPKVLQEIIYRRAGRELENKARSDAIVKFAGIHGDQNIRAFESEWSKYNDPLVFQVEYILKSNLSSSEKQLQVNRILEGVPAEQKQALKEKRLKIKELGG